MASYKVPQNVEADDKLLGPFSFRQFIYLIIAIGSIAIAWVLSKLFLPLLIIPLPVVLLFGALALPLKKDQPMETYLAAIVSFYLKPRKRLWSPDGQQALVEVTAPRRPEKIHRGKDISEDEADKRFSYLANIVDSQGWAVRGVSSASEANSSMNDDVYYEAQQTEDILDASSRQANQINSKLEQTNQAMRQNIIQQMQQQQQQQYVTPNQPVQPVMPTQQYQQPQYQQPSVMPVAPQPQPVGAFPVPPDEITNLTFNPYPTMNQTVIMPASTPLKHSVTPSPQIRSVTTSETVVSPDIIKLASNSDLSIETIAHEANRIKKREQAEDEVVISLR